MFNLKFKRVLAAALSAACLLTLASCGKTGTNNNSEVVGDIKDEDTVLTIGGKDINYEEYKYFYLNSKSYTDGDDETYWENNDEAVTKLKEDTLNSIAQFRAIEMLADEMNVTLSEEDIANNDETIQSYIDYYEYYMQLYSMYGYQFDSLEEFLVTMVGLDKDNWQEQVTDLAKNAVQTSLICYSIAKNQNITVTDEEFNAYVETLIKNNSSESKQYTADEIIEMYGRQQINETLLFDKVNEFLLDNCTIEYKD